MSIPSLSGSTISQAGQVGWQNNLAQRQQHLKDLARALNAGDLTGAKTAFAALQQLQTNSSATIQTQNGQQGSVQNPLAPDYDALDKALKANNLQVAKEAFAKLLQNMQSLRQGHQRYAQQKVSTGKQGTTSTTYSPGVGLTAGSSGSAQNGAGGISLNIYA